MRSKQYYEGRNAYSKGITFNPHSFSENGEYEEWQQGYDDAQADAEDELYMEQRTTRRGFQRKYMASDTE